MVQDFVHPQYLYNSGSSPAFAHCANKGIVAPTAHVLMNSQERLVMIWGTTANHGPFSKNMAWPPPGSMGQLLGKAQKATSKPKGARNRPTEAPGGDQGRQARLGAVRHAGGALGEGAHGGDADHRADDARSLSSIQTDHVFGNVDAKMAKEHKQNLDLSG